MKKTRNLKAGGFKWADVVPGDMYVDGELGRLIVSVTHKDTMTFIQVLHAQNLIWFQTYKWAWASYQSHLIDYVIKTNR